MDRLPTIGSTVNPPQESWFAIPRIMQGEEAGIPDTIVRQLVGTGASDWQGKGNINAGDGGIAFVVASAESIPGSPELVIFSFKL